MFRLVWKLSFSINFFIIQNSFSFQHCSTVWAIGVKVDALNSPLDVSGVRTWYCEQAYTSTSSWDMAVLLVSTSWHSCILATAAHWNLIFGSSLMQTPAFMKSRLLIEFRERRFFANLQELFAGNGARKSWLQTDTLAHLERSWLDRVVETKTYTRLQASGMSSKWVLMESESQFVIHQTSTSISRVQRADISKKSSRTLGKSSLTSWVMHHWSGN